MRLKIFTETLENRVRRIGTHDWIRPAIENEDGDFLISILRTCLRIAQGG